MAAVTEDERKRISDDFRMISFKFVGGNWETGFVMESRMMDIEGFMEIWDKPIYDRGPMYWNIARVERFKLYEPRKEHLDSWMESIGDGFQ